MKKNLDLWKPTCENYPWKLVVQSFMWPFNPKNHLTEFFSKFYKLGRLLEWEVFF
jgi:hypothetical protein